MGKINKWETGNRLWYSQGEGQFSLGRAKKEAKDEYNADRIYEGM